MLFMVIERFKDCNVNSVGERFRPSRRMMPEGVHYHASWVDAAGARCFQVMEAPNPEMLHLWVSRWHDLVEFEIVPIQTSSDFWSSLLPAGA